MEPPIVAQAVETELVPYLQQHGFSRSAEDRHSIRFDSAAVEAHVTWDPRGEIALFVQRRHEKNVHARWQYGEVTTAGAVAGRLRHLVSAFMENPAILAGDESFYDHLRRRNEQRSTEMTAYYSGKAPRPKWMGEPGSAGRSDHH